jgi:transposase
MNHRTGLSRQQTLLFPETLEDYVTAENPVRFLDAFVAGLDLHALGFARAIPESTGRPPYHPADLLQLFLYGYLHRIRSSRALERECHRNVELIWLLGKLAPDFKTIADFRKDHPGPLRAVGRQFTLLCRKLELFGGELLAIDGSKLAAVNSREANYNEKKLQQRLAEIDAQIQAYLKALEETDAREAQNPEPLSREQLAEKIAQLQERKEWYEGLEVELETSEEKQISLTDPQARRMHTTPGSVVGYNAQMAVDGKNKLIAAADVTHEVTDLRQLASVAEQAKENLQIQQAEVLADTGYYNAAEVSRCVEQGLTPYVPKADTSANTAQGLYGKSRFQYDAPKDVYVCPAGRQLTYRFETYELGRAIRYYRASGCKTCALRSACTRNKANRTITREENEHLMEAMAARVKAHPEKMRLRKALCEHPFGTIKRWFGYTHFLLKGLEKVRTEWSLITLVYNLKRVLKLVNFEKLMAAVS